MLHRPTTPQPGRLLWCKRTDPLAHTLSRRHASRICAMRSSLMSVSCTSCGPRRSFFFDARCASNSYGDHPPASQLQQRVRVTAVRARAGDERQPHPPLHITLESAVTRGLTSCVARGARGGLEARGGLATPVPRRCESSNTVSTALSRCDSCRCPCLSARSNARIASAPARPTDSAPPLVRAARRRVMRRGLLHSTPQEGADSPPTHPAAS
jgi:hypothetical protein